MEQSKKIKTYIKPIYIFVTFLILSSSCATISYSPKLSLDISPQTINANARIDKFEDISPKNDKKSKPGSFSATNEKSMPSELDLEITNEILDDFNRSGIFSSAKRRNDSSNIILKGKILRFQGKAGLTNFAWVSIFTVYPVILWYFGVPVYKTSTNVELQISIYNNKGDLLGNYSGKHTTMERTSFYRNNVLSLPSKLNNTFGNTVEQIRKKILADKSKLDSF